MPYLYIAYSIKFNHFKKYSASMTLKDTEHSVTNPLFCVHIFVKSRKLHFCFTSVKYT